MNVQAATGGTIATCHSRNGVGSAGCGYQAQSEFARRKGQLAGQGAIPLDPSRAPFGGAFVETCHQRIAPGMRGAATAAKNKYRSNISPTRQATKASSVITASST